MAAPMDPVDMTIFSDLFKQACQKCFGYPVKKKLTETESKIFCNRVLDQTGLSIGWKSIKNYSFFVTGTPMGKTENPSTATLDTLARYVLNAPYTTEIQRKTDESHYPYWFLYKEKFSGSKKKINFKKRNMLVAAIITAAVLVALLIKFFGTETSYQFTDYFTHIDERAMTANGWFVKSKDLSFWNKRNSKPGELTLYTLKGDNWPAAGAKPDIKNLMLRKLPAGCFTAEAHFHDFIPAQEWQQAGVILLEDTLLTGKSIRFSLAFNDNFGGTKMPAEIYLQIITSLGNGFGKPEELAHKPVLYSDSLQKDPALRGNLKNLALRIEKHNNKYRFLYAGGLTENGAFKEIASQEFDMQPRYIGLFAIKGFTNSAILPVRFNFFRIIGNSCHSAP